MEIELEELPAIKLYNWLLFERGLKIILPIKRELWLLNDIYLRYAKQKSNKKRNEKCSTAALLHTNKIDNFP